MSRSGSTGAVRAGYHVHAWSASPLGPPDRWSPALRNAVSLILESEFPMYLAWGPHLALLYNAASGRTAVVGGVLGYFVVGAWEGLFPYLLVVASSSFIYVAVADLIPQMQRHLPWREMLAQVAWIGAGLLLVLAATGLMQGAHG